MDSLLAGTLILPWKGHCAGYDVQRRCACGNHSGQSRKPFRDRTKTVRLPAGITVRLQPGIVFVFTPERFSRSPRNPVRLAPESALLRKRRDEAERSASRGEDHRARPAKSNTERQNPESTGEGPERVLAIPKFLGHTEPSGCEN